MARIAASEPRADCEREYALVLEERGDLRGALADVTFAANIEGERMQLGLMQSG